MKGSTLSFKKISNSTTELNDALIIGRSSTAGLGYDKISTKFSIQISFQPQTNQ